MTHNTCKTKDTAWADWVRSKREQKQMLKADLARLAEISTSYVTLIERDGLIPHLEVTSKIGSALGSVDQARVMAGYLPDQSADFRKSLCAKLDANSPAMAML